MRVNDGVLSILFFTMRIIFVLFNIYHWTQLLSRSWCGWAFLLLLRLKFKILTWFRIEWYSRAYQPNCSMTNCAIAARKIVWIFFFKQVCDDSIIWMHVQMYELYRNTKLFISSFVTFVVVVIFNIHDVCSTFSNFACTQH